MTYFLSMKYPAAPSPNKEMIDEEARSVVKADIRAHIPALDGLRGIAILMVFMVHLNQKPLLAGSSPILTNALGRVASSGRFGVELFFVLSGFLITGILLDTKRRMGFFKNFYARRLLRIFPLYYGALAVVLLVLPH